MIKVADAKEISNWKRGHSYFPHRHYHLHESQVQTALKKAVRRAKLTMGCGTLFNNSIDSGLRSD
jgi:hypothetical protein